MKLDKEEKEIIRTEEFEEESFGIDDDNIAHIFDILRNKIYSNKILACIREYSTNAQDAHVDVNTPERPIKVALPSVLNPYFTVRDYGLGLSYSEIKEIYVKYGSSTKRGNNKTNGQLGLGSKAGFSYTNSFRVTSIHEGFKTEYEAYIDESNIGKIAKLGAPVETTEESGVQITIPVNSSDIRTFQQIASQFYYHFSPAPEGFVYPTINTYYPEFNNENYSFTGIKHSSLAYNSDYILRIDSQNITFNLDFKNSHYATMANVAYPINYKLLQQACSSKQPLLDIITNFQRLTSNHYLNLKFKIGELAFNSAREELEYNEKTIKSLLRKFQLVYKDINEVLEKQVSSAPNYHKAARAVNEICNTLGLRTDNVIKYKDKPVSTKLILTNEDIEKYQLFIFTKQDDLNGIDFSYNYSKNEYEPRLPNDYSISLIDSFFYDDTDQKPELSNVTKNLLNLPKTTINNEIQAGKKKAFNEIGTYYPSLILKLKTKSSNYRIEPIPLICYGNKALFDQFFEDFGLDLSLCTELSQLEDYKPPVFSRSRTNLNMQSSGFSYFKFFPQDQGSRLKPLVAMPKGTILDPNSQYVYAKFHRNKVYLNDIPYNMDDIWELQKSLESENIDISNVIFIKNQKVSKVPKNWIKFEDFLKVNFSSKIEKEYIKNAIMQKYNVINNTLGFNRDWLLDLIYVTTNDNFFNITNFSNSFYGYKRMAETLKYEYNTNYTTLLNTIGCSEIEKTYRSVSHWIKLSTVLKKFTTKTQKHSIIHKIVGSETVDLSKSRIYKQLQGIEDSISSLNKKYEILRFVERNNSEELLSCFSLAYLINHQDKILKEESV